MYNMINITVTVRISDQYVKTIDNTSRIQSFEKFVCLFIISATDVHAVDLNQCIIFCK